MLIQCELICCYSFFDWLFTTDVSLFCHNYKSESSCSHHHQNDKPLQINIFSDNIFCLRSELRESGEHSEDGEGGRSSWREGESRRLAGVREGGDTWRRGGRMVSLLSCHRDCSTRWHLTQPRDFWQIGIYRRNIPNILCWFCLNSYWNQIIIMLDLFWNVNSDFLHFSEWPSKSGKIPTSTLVYQQRGVAVAWQISPLSRRFILPCCCHVNGQQEFWSENTPFPKNISAIICQQNWCWCVMLLIWHCCSVTFASLKYPIDSCLS